MRIRAIIRFRNEEFTRKRLLAGFKTQQKLADYLGIHQTMVCAWETFRDYPKKKKRISELEFALNCSINEIFPPEFIKAIERKIGTPLERVVDVKQLPEYTRGEFLLPSPEKACELKALGATIEETLKFLTEREAKVLKMRFGLKDGNEHTLEEIGQQFRVGGERIRQIKDKAMRKLKHPSRSRILKSFL